MPKITLPSEKSFARIRVIGVGGSGGNATNYMIKTGVDGVEFIAVNTDYQDLAQSKSKNKIHIGKSTTKGLGTGMEPQLGRKAAEEQMEDVKESIKGADMVFVVGGLGGGTYTGAAPVIAGLARQLGILTVTVTTKPFAFEGGQRKEIAEGGLTELSKNSDALIIIPNDNLFKQTDIKTSMADAFTLSDEILYKAVKGVSDLVLKPGEINIDFADVKTILKNSGIALMGSGKGKGSSKVETSVERAINSPLLDVSINGAKKIIFSIATRSRKDITMNEVKLIADKITSNSDPNAKIIFGTSINKELKQGEIMLTVIATGFSSSLSGNIKNTFNKEQNNFEILNSKSNDKEKEKYEVIGDDEEEIDNENDDKDVIDDEYYDNIYEDEDNDDKGFFGKIWK